MAEILVIGDVMLDQYIIGKCERISPEAPVPVLNVEREFQTLGGAANVSSNLAKLGVQVGLIGLVGDDESGKILQEKLIESKIENFLCVIEDHVTTKKTRVVSSGQQIVRVDRENMVEKESIPVDDILMKLEKYEGKIIVISDYAKGLIDEVLLKAIRKVADVKNIKLIIDPKGKNWLKYEGSYLVKPNFKELLEIGGRDILNLDDAVEKLAREVRVKYNLENLLVTRSDMGMTLVNESSKTHFRTKQVEVFDVSGAGDTSLAVIAFMLHNGFSLKDAIIKSNLASAYVITKKGTYAISLEELNQLDPL